MGQKFEYEEVKRFFEENNCKLLSKEYKNARTHLKYQCSCGNISQIIFDSFRSGHRCKKCATIKNAQNQTFSYEFVYNYFKDQGCELLEKEYINCKTKIKYKCSCGNISQIVFRSFQKGARCIKCGIKRRSGENHYEWKKDRKAHIQNQIFKQKCYKMLKYSLKKTKQIKTDRTHIMLGYYPEELQNHIHNHPNWEKVDKNTFHLDHIFPIQAFVDYNIKDIKLINCLDNLQPLEAKKNISKCAKYDKDEFETWLKEKKYDL